MDLKELVERSPQIPIQEDEGCFLIKEYIRIRKGVVVNPIINYNHPILSRLELSKFNRMVNISLNWFWNNKKLL